VSALLNIKNLKVDFAIHGGTVKATIMRSTRVVVTDQAALEEARPDLMRVIPEHREPCKTAIKADLKRGMDIPGVTLAEGYWTKFA